MNDFVRGTSPSGKFMAVGHVLCSRIAIYRLDSDGLYRFVEFIDNPHYDPEAERKFERELASIKERAELLRRG